MLSLLVPRLFGAVFVLFGVSVITFGVVRLIPGDPATNLLGADATQEDVDRIREELRLDEPWPIQYAIWLSRLARGDMGESVVTRQPVRERAWAAFQNSGILATFAASMAIVLGVTLGTVAAVNRGRILDRAVTAVAVTGHSLPPYWVGIMLIYVFAVKLGWLPTGGRESLGDGGMVDQLRHLVLPGCTLALAAMGTIARVTRTSLLEVLGQDYVRTARAKGLHERRVVVLHALRNALIPVINVVGLQVGFLLGSTIIIEQIFAWPGVGRMVFESVTQRDYPLLQGAVLTAASAFVIVNFLVDLLANYMDPRVKFA